ncbi:MAG: hypothetical protein ABW318_21225, partial [Vicinamibacterales bacterium]
MTKSTEPWRDGIPDEVTEMLRDLPEVDPPPALVDNVMSTIVRRARIETMSPTLMTKGRTMAKKVLWSVAAAAAVALVVMRVFGYPPVQDGTEATIGAAQRYQAPQISSADVKLEDAQLQAFLQSDVFRQLASDKVAQEALKNNDFRRALADASVRVALSSPDVVAAIAATAAIAGAPQAFEASNARLDAAKVKLDAVLASSEALRVALASPLVAQAIANSALRVALVNSDAAFALSQQVAVNAVLAAATANLNATAVSSQATAGGATNAAGSAVR